MARVLATAPLLLAFPPDASTAFHHVGSPWSTALAHRGLIATAPDAANARGGTVVSRSRGKANAKIFDIGLGKTGTVSFADYMWRTLEYGVTLHDSGAVYNATGFDIHERSNATVLGESLSNMTFPAYDESLAELTKQSGHFEAVLHANISAYAEAPWWSTFPYVEESLPDAKVFASLAFIAIAWRLRHAKGSRAARAYRSLTAPCVALRSLSFGRARPIPGSRARTRTFAPAAKGNSSSLASAFSSLDAATFARWRRATRVN